ncbi:uncharacterized protein L201_004848 [Kwoniella dendrophila CBS 6074]|uniref:Uncharacterized protein n=1 Tax=Kwoniella dendrophila CBS 6074 TaxID=1295534 RepID=A0AAX4JYI8_9TREE
MSILYLVSLIAFATCISASTYAAQDKETDLKILAGAPINQLNLTVIPDSPVQGENVTLNWGYGSVGNAPYNIQIGTGGYYANLTWLYNYTNLTETNLTWTTNVTAGETLVFQLWDATNTTTYSQNHLILPNNSTNATTSISLESNTTNIPDSVRRNHIRTKREDGDEDESFLGELLAEIQAELDG